MFKFMIVIFINIYKGNRFVFQSNKIDKSLKFYEKIDGLYQQIFVA